MFAPVDHQRFLGQAFVKRQDEVALQIGKTVWSRYELTSALGVGNYRAAALVTRALRHLKLDRIEDIFTCDPADLADEKMLGETGMWVLLRVLEAKGFNPKEWYNDGGNQLVTFRTMKIRRKKLREMNTRKKSRSRKRR